MAFSGDVLHLAARPSTFLIRYGIIESLGVYIEYVRIVGTRCPMSLFGVWVQKTEIHGTNGMNNILKQAAPLNIISRKIIIDEIICGFFVFYPIL